MCVNTTLPSLVIINNTYRNFKLRVMVDVDKWLATVKECKCIPEKDLRLLCDRVGSLHIIL